MMVLYDFECETCGHLFEKYVKMGSQYADCPKCGALMKKIISKSTFILKGDGWEKDGYGLRKSKGKGHSNK